MLDELVAAGSERIELASHLLDRPFARRAKLLVVWRALALARAPLGEEVWAECRVNLRRLDPAAVENVITGERLEPQGPAGDRFLPVSQALNHFPVALLASATRAAD
jgi:hypothetical protein